MVRIRSGLLKAVSLVRLVVLLGPSGVDVCTGFDGLTGVGLALLKFSEVKELGRSTGVVLNNEEEKLGMPHWQQIQVVSLWLARYW